MPNIELKLFPNFVTIIVQLLSTGVLFLLFKKYLWKYVLDFMDKRADAIEKNINDAKDMREKATVYLQESEEQARASAKQYREIIDLAKEDANKAKQQIMNEANEQARNKIAQAEEQIEAEKAQARAEMKEEIVDIDFGKERLSMVYNLRREDDEDPAYTCRLQLQVTEGQLVFTVKDVKMHGGLKSMFSNFDKLDPVKKTKHADIIREFERLNDAKLNNLFNFIKEHQLQVTNWDNIRSGSLQRGMTEDEVMLIYGKPVSKQSDGTTTQYMFNSFVRVFIENGKVKSFVN